MQVTALYWLNRGFQWVIDTIFVVGILSIVVIFSGIKIEFDPAGLQLADDYMAAEKASESKVIGKTR